MVQTLWASGCVVYCACSQVVSEQSNKLIKGQLVYCHKFCAHVMCMQVCMRESETVYAYDTCVYKQVYINT